MLEQAESLGLAEPERILELALQAEAELLEHPEEVGDDRMLPRSLNLQAGALRILGRHREALDKAGQAYTLFSQADDSAGMAASHVIQSAIYSLLGNNPKALEHGQEGLEIHRRSGDVLGQIKAFNNMGIVHRDIGNLQRAIECYEEAYDLSQREDAFKWASFYILNNMGLVYRDLEDYDTALDCFNQVVDLEASPKCGGLGSTTCHIGEIKVRQGKYDEALSFYLRALDLCRVEKNQEYVITSLVNLGDLHLLEDFCQYNLDTSETYLLEALDLAKESQFSRMQARTNLLLSRVYEAKRNPEKALHFHKVYHEITESVRNEQASKKLADLQIAFDLDKSQREAEVVQSRNTELAALNQQIEEQRRDLARMNEKLQRLVQEKSEFLSIAAHDLKSPLAVISGYAQLVQEEARENPAEVREYGNIIEITANRLSLLVLNLLDVNAIESGALVSKNKRIDLGLVVDAIVREFNEQATKKNIAITVSPAQGETRFFGDHLAVEQVVRNLLSNAIKFSPPGSAVVLKVFQRGEYVCLSVIDSGPGIPEEDQRKLFQRFARLTPRPTGDEHSSGLGLYIVKQRVKAMNGRVSCQSEPGQGTDFTVELPIAPQESS